MEYREIKPYWTKRFFKDKETVKVYNEIHFRNGYRKDSPNMIVEWKGLVLEQYEGKWQYGIILGKVLSVEYPMPEVIHVGGV